MDSKANSKVPNSTPTPKSKKTQNPRLVITVSRNFKISICKPLIPLKIALTLWYGASLGTTAYLTLYFKQRGLTVEEISFMYLAAYLSQFVFNTACGVVSDKIGRPICMTLLSIFIAGTLAAYLSFTPKVDDTIVENQPFSSLYCAETNYVPIEIRRTCVKTLQEIPCEEMCSKDCCKDVSLNKPNLMSKFVSHSVSSFQNGSENVFNWCFRDSKTVLLANDTRILCKEYQQACTETCAKHISTTKVRKSSVLLLIAIVVFFLTFDENTYRFLDVLANNMVNTFEAEYGKQAFWSNTGALLGPSLVAFVIQQASTSEEFLHYEASLYFYATVALLTFVTVCTLEVSTGKPAQQMSSAATKLFKNVDFLFFLFVLFVLGGTWGFLMSFHNLFLANIGTPIYMMGLLDTFSGLCGLPVLFTGKWLTDKIGHSNVFSLALLGYFFKCFGYSFLRVAWPVFFLELLMTFSYHLLWVATIDFCTKIGPEDLKGTVITLAGTVHYSLGRACGSFSGGLLMSAYGASAAFQVIGAANGTTFLIYNIYQHFKRSRRTKKFDISEIP